MPHIRSLHVEERTDALILDAATRRNLEFDVSLSGHPEATLFALLDQCVTAMGSRQLRRWLNRPLTDQRLLRGRYQASAHSSTDGASKQLREQLRGIGDIERILSRVALRSARPRDLTQLRSSLAVLPALRAYLAAHRLTAVAGVACAHSSSMRTWCSCCQRQSPVNLQHSYATAM